jgi:hypothetical protein
LITHNLESHTFGLHTIQLNEENIKKQVDCGCKLAVAYAAYQVDRVLLTKSLHISQDLKPCKKLINLMQMNSCVKRK